MTDLQLTLQWKNQSGVISWWEENVIDKYLFEICAKGRCKPWDMKEVTSAWLKGCGRAVSHYQSPDQPQTGRRGKKIRLYSKVLLNLLLGIDGYCSMAELAYSPALHTPSFLLITTDLRQFKAQGGNDIQKGLCNKQVKNIQIFSEPVWLQRKAKKELMNGLLVDSNTVPNPFPNIIH